MVSQETMLEYAMAVKI